ncbi:hypothetical protein EHV15_36240 [Paenibacillus oralis]|uniref:Uncharacterized protein n=1 Tax=Paenibacillus oralis TaxID=2490856 RepID=A0A3P3TC07_9BACL|nr:hypothetical protein [Paenibacillus oralis]RRJ54013.1 hypothetical protein EHV15_36240 [Paenibacillus oralis]
MNMKTLKRVMWVIAELAVVAAGIWYGIHMCKDVASRLTPDQISLIKSLASPENLNVRKVFLYYFASIFLIPAMYVLLFMPSRIEALIMYLSNLLSSRKKKELVDINK